MRQLLAGVLLLSFAWASPVFGQGFEEDLVCAEKPTTLFAGHRYPITILTGAQPGQVKLTFGDLAGRCLPKPVIAGVMFMIKWAKRQLVGGLPPVLIKNQAYGALQFTVTPPIGPFTLQAQTIPGQVQIALKQMVVSGPDGQSGTSGQLSLRRDDLGEWKIASIAIP